VDDVAHLVSIDSVPAAPESLTRRALGAIALCTEGIVVITVIANIAVTFCNTLDRYLFKQDFPWATDVSAIMIAIIAFLGSAAYFRRCSGMAYTALIDHLDGLNRQAVEACGLWLMFAVCAVALLYFPEFFVAQASQRLPVLGISAGFVAVWLGVGLTLLALFCLEKIALLNVRAILIGVVVVSVVAVAVWALRAAYADGRIEIDPFVPIAFVLLLAFASGAPVAIVLALGGMLYFLVSDAAPMTAVPSSLHHGIGSFILLAIPFFMIAGMLMEITGMAKRLVDMVQKWVGHWRGGLLIAEVLATYIFSGISGSKSADIATIGSVMKGPMRAYGYPSTEFVAVLAASAAMSETVPPSVAMLILGSVTSLSIGALFVAGVIPAAILALALIIAVVIRSRLKGYRKGAPFAPLPALRSIVPALPALGVPVIVIGGLVGGIASPTESASFAVVYGLVVAVLVYRSLGPRQCLAGLRDATLLAGMVLLLVSASNVFVQAIVIDGLGRTLGTAFNAIHGPTTFLFLSAGALIVLGFVLEGFPAVLISAPIFLPVAIRMGIDPLQFGILLIIATGIGVMMPPVGVGFYISCAVGEAPANAAMRPSFFYNIFLLLGLVVVILYPQLTLWLPHQFGMH
jgi:C4-dicarboxylate transporter DctM subunit